MPRFLSNFVAGIAITILEFEGVTPEQQHQIDLIVLMMLVMLGICFIGSILTLAISVSKGAGLSLPNPFEWLLAIPDWVLYTIILGSIAVGLWSNS